MRIRAAFSHLIGTTFRPRLIETDKEMSIFPTFEEPFASKDKSNG